VTVSAERSPRRRTGPRPKAPASAWRWRRRRPAQPQEVRQPQQLADRAAVFLRGFIEEEGTPRAARHSSGAIIRRNGRRRATGVARPSGTVPDERIPGNAMKSGPFSRPLSRRHPSPAQLACHQAHPLDRAVRAGRGHRHGEPLIADQLSRSLARRGIGTRARRRNMARSSSRGRRPTATRSG